jgi:protein tyrosine phosphatase (PTP) superfamily phosphohydrolase (DUF442 family)
VSGDHIGGQSSHVLPKARTVGRLAVDPRESNVISPRSPEARASVERQRRTIAFPILCVAAVAGIGAGLWLFVLRDRFVAKRFGVVVAGEVYRSGQISRHMIADVIDRYRIGTIIDLNGFDPSDPDQRAEAAVSRSKGVRHCCFPLKGDSTGKIDRYADAIEALVESQRKGIPVLVHCYAGTQRTGACISFYSLLVRREPPDKAYEELGRYGWDSRSDQVLLDYVNSHMRDLADLLVQRHVLERVPDEIPRLHR